MLQETTLKEIVERLGEFDEEETIYAAEPWLADCRAVVVRESESGDLPSGIKDSELKYFLEVAIAREFIQDWIASLKNAPSLSQICQRLIDYATNDA